MPPILLDTHIAVWSANGSLTSAAARTIDAAATRGELLLSPISAWEVGMLVARGRLVLAHAVDDYVRGLFGQAGVVTAALTPAIAAAAALLPAAFPGDPADRMIVATAVAYGAQLVTRDKAIRAYAKATRTLRCIAA